jgi:hypothetical protein
MLAFLSKSFDLKICFWSIDCRTMIGWNLFKYLHEIKNLNPLWFRSNTKVPQQSLFSLYTTFENPGPHLNDYWISMGWPLDEFWRLSEFPWSRMGPHHSVKGQAWLSHKIANWTYLQKTKNRHLGPRIWKIHVCQKRSQQVNKKPHVPPLNLKLHS